MPKTLMLHPKAYLTSKRNVKAGLVARTKILRVLEKGRNSTSNIAKEATLSYNCVAYHLKAMKKDRLVDRELKKRSFTWGPTRFGQQELPTQ